MVAPVLRIASSKPQPGHNIGAKESTPESQMAWGGQRASSDAPVDGTPQAVRLDVIASFGRSNTRRAFPAREDSGLQPVRPGLVRELVWGLGAAGSSPVFPSFC